MLVTVSILEEVGMYSGLSLCNTKKVLLFGEKPYSYTPPLSALSTFSYFETAYGFRAVNLQT